MVKPDWHVFTKTVGSNAASKPGGSYSEKEKIDASAKRAVHFCISYENADHVVI